VKTHGARWIDVIIKYQISISLTIVIAGITEVALKIIMLIKPTGVDVNNVEHVDLVAERLKLENLIPSEVQEFLLNKNDL
jgi:type III secretion system FlhB-like substrate exporter